MRRHANEPEQRDRWEFESRARELGQYFNKRGRLPHAAAPALAGNAAVGPAGRPPPRGDTLILADLWESCRLLGLDLPQPRPVAASSMCAAHAKVGSRVFRCIHDAVLHHAGGADAAAL